MQCPFCLVLDTKVVDSRLAGSDGEQVRRRRECICCHARFTTYEVVELSLPRLIKQDGSFVQFKEEKLRAGILRSLEKRPVPTEEVDKLVSKIYHKLRSSGEREVSTLVLGKWVMEELKKLDPIAYIRFASVYRRFEKIDDFFKEIENLSQQNEKV